MFNLNKAVPKGAQIILKTLVGSTVHGTAVDNQDDRDEMAIAVEPMEYVAGMERWETSVERTKPEGVRSGPGDVDRTTHSLRKFCKLAAAGNPTILLPLFVSGDGILFQDFLGNSLIRDRKMFFSKLCGKAFLGYMQEQKARLTGQSGGRHGSRPELLEKFGFDTKYAGHIVRLGYQGLELMRDETISLPMKARQREEVVAIRTGLRTLKQTLELADDLERDLKVAIGMSPFPEEADRTKINQFLVQAHQHVWEGQRIRAKRA